ncbi:MAG: hypothetical protein GY705_04620 [Bacteroidetes bacterium]|nr:hypothetical protein [Bacteroidota bacterium]
MAISISMGYINGNDFFINHKKVYCVLTKTLKLSGIGEHDEGGEGLYASTVIAEGKLYLIDTDGIMHIFALSKEKQILAEPALREPTIASPAFNNNRIYLRGEEHLYCIGGDIKGHSYLNSLHSYFSVTHPK